MDDYLGEISLKQDQVSGIKDLHVGDSADLMATVELIGIEKKRDYSKMHDTPYKPGQKPKKPPMALYYRFRIKSIDKKSQPL